MKKILKLIVRISVLILFIAIPGFHRVFATSFPAGSGFDTANTWTNIQTFQSGAGDNFVPIVVNQNDTTNNPKAFTITNGGSGNTLFLDPNGNTSSSNSTGGALLVENTGNIGWAINVHSSNPSPSRLVQFVVNSAFTTTATGAQTLSTASSSLVVGSTTGFPTSGLLRVVNSTSTTENGEMAYLHYTSVDVTHFYGTAGAFYKVNTSLSLPSGALVDYMNTTNTYFTTLLEDSSTNDGVVNLKLRGPNPDLEFHSLGGYNNDVGEGQFELDIPTGDNVNRTDTDVLRINGRNDADTSFQTNTIFTRPGLAAEGLVGIGFQNKVSPVTIAAHLHIVNSTNFGDSSAASLIGEIIQGAPSQTANLLEFRNSSNTVLSYVSASGGFVSANSNYYKTQDTSGNTANFGGVNSANDFHFAPDLGNGTNNVDSAFFGYNSPIPFAFGGGTSLPTSFNFNSSGNTTFQTSGSTKFTVSSTGVILNTPERLKGYTVGTLPTGTQGDTAFVTDATAPTWHGPLTGGGSVVTPVFYNGTVWVAD